MVSRYICGYIKTQFGNNTTDYHFPNSILPQGYQNYIVWEGLVNGYANGFKGKADYLGRLVFLMVDSDTQPTQMIVVRVTFDFTLNIVTDVDVFELVDGEIITTIPTPNQLTIDYQNNIYIAGGSGYGD